MSIAIVGVIGSLLGVAPGFVGQYIQERMKRQESLKDTKRKAHVGYLRAVDASYTQAYEKGEIDRPEDREIRMARAEVQLLARQKIYEKVSEHSDDVIKAHDMVARDRKEAGGTKPEPEMLKPDTKKEVEKARALRWTIIQHFKSDLGIKDDSGTKPRVRYFWRRWRH
jgi:hypothetical protein